MNSLKTIRRITIYASQEHENSLIKQILSMGAKGYTITEAKGMGEHASLDDPFTHSTHVRIEILVQPETAERIMSYFSGLNVKHLPIVACVEDVEVNRSEHF